MNARVHMDFEAKVVKVSPVYSHFLKALWEPHSRIIVVFIEFAALCSQYN